MSTNSGKGFRSFGEPDQPPEPEPDLVVLPMMLLPVRLAVDAASLEQLGYSIAEVVSAAVRDGVRVGLEEARAGDTSTSSTT